MMKMMMVMMTPIYTDDNDDDDDRFEFMTIYNTDHNVVVADVFVGCLFVCLFV